MYNLNALLSDAPSYKPKEQKDYTIGSRSTFNTLGARNYAKYDREINDYYATEPKAMELLLLEETFNHKIWECACGEGHLSKVLLKNGYDVKSTDLIDRGYGIGNVDFFEAERKWDGDIITNPPYKIALDFVQKAIDLIPNGNKVAMFLKLQFLEGKARRKFFNENPPKTVYVSSARLNCARNGDFEKCKSSAMAYAWFVWEKGYKNYPIIKWFN